MAEFDAWADLYDTLHPGTPGDARFYVTRALEAGGTVLELGCGTGRIALAMALSGVDVVGLDLSESMLDLAADKRDALDELPGEVDLVVGDMRDFDLERVFNLIAMPYRSFMHLHEPEDQVACLESVREHLAPGGTFIFNTWDPRPSAIAKFTGQLRTVDRLPIPETDGFLLHTMSTRADEGEQRLYEDHIIHEVDGEGIVEASFCLNMVRTWTSYRELLHLVERCGFEVVEVLGDFREDPRSDDTSEMIWVLRAATPSAA